MTEIDFRGFPKISRLFREVVITEKIDGTNGAVGIVQYPFGWHVGGACNDEADKVSGCDGYSYPHDHNQPRNAALVFHPDDRDETGLPDFEYLVFAQSRNRVIIPESDNHGFARWVWDNAVSLVADLGPGLHFGEWWGQGIGRKYGLAHKQFSLFNVKRWEGEEFKTAQLDTVPVLSRGLFSTALVAGSLLALGRDGSFAAPGFKNPEGIVVYHTAGNVLFKVTLEDDEAPKSLSVLRRQEAELAA